jgi:acetylornithine deacetylase/succinyl-diaminopimelate desuccinylase-like protein
MPEVAARVRGKGVRLQMRIRRFALLTLAFATLTAFRALAVAAEQAPNPAPGAQIDWNQLDAEALGYFRTYLHFDTTNPPSNTRDAIAFLKQILDREGIATETFESKPGMVTLVARLPGPPGLKPLLLMSHADVVPAVGANWSHPPFAAELAGGYVWGRGAIDNKAHGIMALMTLLALKRQHTALRRGVELMINPDEEAGGDNGAGWMVEHHWDAIDPAFAVNEGGSATRLPFAPNRLTMSVAVAEKRVMWLKLTARGKAGHGSIPIEDNPNLILIRALARLLREQPPLTLTPVVAEGMAAAAPGAPLPDSFTLAHLQWPYMLELAARGPLKPDYLQALLRNTITPTMLAAGYKVNVIPSTAEAGIDCRVLPGTDADALLARIRDLLGDSRISIDLIQKPDQAPSSPTSGEMWDAIKSVVASDFKDTTVVPWMTTGGTDSRFLRQKGVPAYGFVPVVLTRDDLGRVHGVDERLSVENLNLGIKATYDLAVALCAAQK